MKPIRTMLSLTLLTVSCQLYAQPIDHFKGEPAATVEQASALLNKYNPRLASLLQGDLSGKDLAEIHQITYSLENALLRIEQDLKQTMEQLEQVHQGSEQGDRVTVRNQSEKYLQNSTAFR